MKLCTLALVICLWSTGAFSEPVIDVSMVAGKSKEEVSKLIGNPSSCRSGKYGETCMFSKGESEIVFIKGRADWITVEGIDDVAFNSSALESIGLQTQNPTFKNNFTMRWSGISGLREVSIFKGGANCDYAYIKAYTK